MWCLKSGSSSWPLNQRPVGKRVLCLPVSAVAVLRSPGKVRRVASPRSRLSIQTRHLCKSSTQISAETICDATDFFCRFYTVSFIYNKNQLISYFIFYKRTTPVLWVREEKTDHVRRACVPFAAASVAVRPQSEIR